MGDSLGTEFERIMETPRPGRYSGKPQAKFDIDPEKLQNGVAQLVLTLVKLVHELLEKQAIRRMDSGSITDEEIENVGLALMQQAEELDTLRQLFNLEEKDLNIDLGPLGRLL